MKRQSLFLISPFLLSLFACSPGETISSESSLLSSSKVEQEVTNVNLAYSDMENGLSNFFFLKNNGVRILDVSEEEPSFLLSLKSKNTFDEIGKESKASDEIKTYSLDIYSDDLSFKMASLDNYNDFHFGLMAKSLLFELEEKTTDTSLPFRQGFNLYFAKGETQSGFYFDSSKSALSRALIENLYPDVTLYERSFLDCSKTYEKMESLFPLNKKASNIASFLRKEAQNLYENKKARLFTYEGEESTHFTGKYDDASSFKEEATNLLDLFFEDGETKDKLSSYVDRLQSIDLSFDYLFDMNEPLSLTLNGSLSFESDENGEGLSSLQLNTSMNFLKEDESDFALPKEISDSSLWTPLL